MNTPRVSIIVPVYKVEAYLEQCVRSIQNQTLREIEIILVDDGSPDQCPQMCDRYAAEDERIRVIHQNNAGVSVARNNGIQAATADWLMFVDSDDWLEENALELLYQSTIDPEYEIIVGSYFTNTSTTQTSKASGLCTAIKFTEKTSKDILFALIVGIRPHGVPKIQKQVSVWWGVPWAKLYRKNLLVENCLNFPSGLKCMEDTIFNLYSVAFSKAISIVDTPIYHYRVRKLSASRMFMPDLKCTLCQGQI